MIYKMLSHTDLAESTVLHEEGIEIPQQIFSRFERVLNDPARNDIHTEVVIKNLLNHGARRADRVDPATGDVTPGVRVSRFPDESSLHLHRSGGELDPHDAPLPVQERYFRNGLAYLTIDYNHSGHPEHVSFDATNKATHFRNNLDNDAAIGEMRSIVAYNRQGDVVSFDHGSLALTA